MLMRGFPSIAGLLVALAGACGGSESPAPEPGRAGEPVALALVPGDLPGLFPGGASFVSGAGDTLVYGVETLEEDDRLRLWRVRRSAAGTDSVAAIVDAATGAPIESWQWRLGGSGERLTAHVVYGAGFEGQARLVLTSEEGRMEENLRTPLPVLDAAQIPQILARLDLSSPDTVPFNYVAPFEREALAARIVIGAAAVPPAGGGDPAIPVRVQVGGLEERYWFAAPPAAPRLLRVEEPTRSLIWMPAAP